MEGSLRQRGKQKVWYLCFDLGRASNGKRNQKNIKLGRMSKAEAEAKKREILRRHDDGEWFDSQASATVDAFLQSWLASQKPYLATTTHERYSSLLNLHVMPLFGKLKLSKFQPEHARTIYSAMEQKKLSGRTRLHVHRVLHKAFNDAVRVDRVLKENPLSRVKAPRPDHRELPLLSHDQIRQIFEIAKGSRLEVPVVIATLTGLRRGEVLALRWKDVNVEAAELFVSQAVEQTRTHGVRFKSPKSKSSCRKVPLAPEVVEVFRMHRASQDEARKDAAYYEDNDLVFCNVDGTPWPPNTLTAQFAAIRKLVGLPGFRLHDLRHAFGTLLLADGHSIKEVQLLMGHSNASTTLNVYARALEGLGREAVNGLARSLLNA